MSYDLLKSQQSTNKTKEKCIKMVKLRMNFHNTLKFKKQMILLANTVDSFHEDGPLAQIVKNTNFQGT